MADETRRDGGAAVAAEPPIESTPAAVTDEGAAARPQPVVVIDGLTKRYGDLVAVDNLSLRIYEGEIFGLLGPNGAGKTTTILMLLGLSEPNSGRLRVCGINPTREPLKVKRIVGYLPDNVGFYPDLSARDNLMYTADLNGIPRKIAQTRIMDLLEQVGLADVAKKRVGEFSRGMRQRLGIADVLVKEPRVVFMDEPTLGIDPDGMQHMLELITRMSKENRITVLLSSHQLHQVQAICHRVGIFVRGKLVAAGPIETLGAQILKDQSTLIEVQASPSGNGTIAALKSIDGVEDVRQEGDLLIAACESDIRPQIARALVEHGADLKHLRLRGYGLEDIYLQYFHEEK
jgi:ABC-2 type transport system ATP-binding protein